MTRARAVLLAALVWCAVVGLVASLVWVVISRAGAGVVPLSQPQADVTGSLPVPGGHARPQRTSPGVTLTPRPTRSASPSGGTTTPPPPPTSPTTTPTTPPPSSPTGPTTPATPRAQRRSWSGSAGHVVAECRGPRARLVSAFPNTDWRYTILERGPARVRVHFARTVGDDKAVTVDARCVDGVPHFWLPGGGDD